MCYVYVDTYQGYLGLELHTKYGCRVLGLESKQCHTARAEYRHAQLGQLCTLSVKQKSTIFDVSYMFLCRKFIMNMS